MRYLIEPRDLKGYGFFSFAKNRSKNIGTHATKIAKNLSDKDNDKLLHSAKKSTTDIIKAVSKKVIQNIEEATGDLMGNKIANKTTNSSKKSSENVLKTDENELEIPKEIYIFPDSKLMMN